MKLHAQPGDRTSRPWHRGDWVLPIELYSELNGQNCNKSSPPYTHPATISPVKYLRAAFNTLEGWILHFHAYYLMHCFTATVLATTLEYPTRALQAWRTDTGRHCNSVDTCQPGDPTSNPDIVMLECYQLSQRVNSKTRVYIFLNYQPLWHFSLFQKNI